MERPTATLTTGKGQPLRLTLGMRQSTTVPHRIKVAFVAPLKYGLAIASPEGELHAQAVPDGPDDAAMIVGNEFRIELN